MSLEQFGAPAVNHEVESVIVNHGGEEYFHDTFGLGRAELEQTVTYGGHTGSVAQMLVDEKCPVGSKLQEAYQEGGLEAVQGKLNLLSEFAPEFTVTISASSVEREQLKKK